MTAGGIYGEIVGLGEEDVTCDRAGARRAGRPARDRLGDAQGSEAAELEAPEEPERTEATPAR